MSLEEQVAIFEKLIEKVHETYVINLGDSPIELFMTHKIYYKFIFDHDFQKALWGDVFTNEFGQPFVVHLKKKKTKVNVNMNAYKPAWQYHAQKMAIANDYLEYLKKFI